MLTAASDIQYLKGVGEKRAVLLKNKGIDTVGALLRFYPRAYRDWRNPLSIAACPYEQNVCVRAKIITPVKAVFKREGITVYKFLAEDDSAQLLVTLFNQKYLAERLRFGEEYLFYGKIGGNLTGREISSPVIMNGDYNGMEPIYPVLGKLSSKKLESLIKTALSAATVSETLPTALLEKNGLCSLPFALRNIHFPENPEAFEQAKRRLVFEELFILQTALSFLKSRSRGMAGCVIHDGETQAFQAALSFPMTGAQQRVIGECLADMMSGRPMNRLVQGDVGSGKTVVAAALCFVSAKNGFQSALMAPTEILAEQHYKTLCEITRGTGIRCGLLTGSLSKKQKAEIKEALKNGEIQVAVGTHALLSEDVAFQSLGLVITDEQHRFGVAQRGKLSAKGDRPHTLVMSATPIPRTLGLIVYGDLDISVVDEYPKGRQKIDTYCVDSGYRARIYRYLKKFLNEGRQAYIVCPLVEENETVPLSSAAAYYEKLKEEEFRDCTVGLLHGKLSAKEKDRVMRAFAAGEIQLLVATTVVEVGVDVPNAVVMVIENAERFGLSQLHQLRGRIGRGTHKSVCIMISDAGGEDTKRRLSVIRECCDGFRIADEDLKLRGPGDFLGRRQHGLPEMKIADLFADRETLSLAGKEAQALLHGDPRLKKPENAGLRAEVALLYRRLNRDEGLCV